MDAEQFIHALKLTVRDGAIDGTIGTLASPPGRRPSKELSQRAEWYSCLDEDDRFFLAQTIAFAADMAVFGFLCVLDGVCVVEDGPIKGHFELRYVKDGAKLLNPPDGIMLHDLYNAG
jgi:hypothetical protein